MGGTPDGHRSPQACRQKSESDWRILRRLHKLALARFPERVLAEIDCIMRCGGRTHHQRYLAIYNLIHVRNERMAEVFDNSRRSVAVSRLARIRTEGLLTDEELSELSQETRSGIEFLLAHW